MNTLTPAAPTAADTTTTYTRPVRAQTVKATTGTQDHNAPNRANADYLNSEVARPVPGVKLNPGIAHHIQRAHNLHDIGQVARLLDADENYLAQCLEGTTEPNLKLIAEIVSLTGLSIAQVAQPATKGDCFVPSSDPH
ncbi:hypothetical protein [Mobiluncus sp.]|uniref:hypothetical protein n=1 Tax=Mobiluncus sp. TaxID=47293 RepID=UPI002A915C81|nr:hypothetical protein [Mobiluncus sp.]MDY6077126.1 hypothetical protein [Mobiluncus sp.]